MRQLYQSVTSALRSVQASWGPFSPDAKLTAMATIGAAVLGSLLVIGFQTRPADQTRQMISTTPGTKQSSNPLPEPQATQQTNSGLNQRGDNHRDLRPRLQAEAARERSDHFVRPSTSIDINLPLTTTTEDPAIRTNQFLNDGASADAIAVVILNAGKEVANITEPVARQLDGTTALFKPYFVNSGLYTQVFAGDTAALNKLGLQDRTNAVLLGNIESRTLADPREPTLRIVTITCDAKLFLARKQFQYRSLSVSAKGVNFNEERASREAIDNLVTNIVREVKGLL